MESILQIAGLETLGEVTKIAGNSVLTSITLRNIGDSQGTWTIGYDFEHDSAGAPIIGSYKVITLAAGQTTTITDTKTVPNGYEGYSYRLVVYWKEGIVSQGGDLPNFELQNWWMVISGGVGVLDIRSTTIY